MKPRTNKCECGAKLVRLPNGTVECAATVARFKAVYGYSPGSKAVPR